MVVVTSTTVTSVDRSRTSCAVTTTAGCCPTRGRSMSIDLAAVYHGQERPSLRSRLSRLAVRKAAGSFGEQLKPRVAHTRFGRDKALAGQPALIAQESTDGMVHELLATIESPFLDRAVQGLSEARVERKLHP